MALPAPVATRGECVVLDRISKSFDAVHAVIEASVCIDAGAVTAIVGENGAGKSTLMKVLAGVERPDSGTLTIDGRRCAFRSAREATEAGVGMVYQETSLVGSLRVWENIALGWEAGPGPVLSRRENLDRIRSLCHAYQLPIPVDAFVDDLPVSVRQQVEIVKVLYRDVQVIILDEPTSALTPQEARGLFRALDVLRRAGKSVVFISHKLNEVLELADRIVVMRAGCVVGQVDDVSEVQPQQLAKMMLGGELDRVVRAPIPRRGRPVLRLDGLECGTTLSAPVGPISLEVPSGTILGIAGVAGSGQDEFIATITGSRPPVRGTAVFDGHRPVQITPKSKNIVRSLRDAGLRYAPADRNTTGTLAGRPLWFSAIAGRQWHRPYSRRGALDIGASKRLTQEIIQATGVKAPGVEALPGQLSGGNLQKFMIGRELQADPVALVVEEPTRGIDIGAAILIRQRLRDLADGGAAVIVVSSDLDELLQISDDIAVFFNGDIVQHRPASETTPDSLGAAMTGLSSKERGTS